MSHHFKYSSVFPPNRVYRLTIQPSKSENDQWRIMTAQFIDPFPHSTFSGHSNNDSFSSLVQDYIQEYVLHRSHPSLVFSNLEEFLCVSCHRFFLIEEYRPFILWDVPGSLWGSLMIRAGHACFLFSLFYFLNYDSMTTHLQGTWKIQKKLHYGCCCSVAKWCPTLCDPMDCSPPGSPVLHHLPELAQTQVHWVSDAIQTSHPLYLEFQYKAFKN